MYRKLLLPLAVMAGLAVMTGCNQDNPEQIDESTELSVQDNNFAELEGDAMADMAEGEAMSPTSGKTNHHPGGLHLRAGECASVEFDTVRAPGSTLAKRVTITFNPTTACRDGKTRSGQIIVTWFGFIREENMQAGRAVLIRTNNYVVNGNQVKSRRSILTLLTAGQPPVQNVEARDTVIRANGAGTVTNASNRQRRWVQGFFTMNPFDDVFTVTGQSTGTNRRGETYSAGITTPIRIERACRWPVSGVLEVRSGDRPTRQLDFGAGNCDNLAILRIGDRSKTIQLP